MKKFPLFAPYVPRIGRERLFKRMVDELTKPTPQSLSLVGPRYSGKSVLLSAIANAPEVLASYTCVVFWDLGHQIPQSDEEFISLLISKISTALHASRPDIHMHLSKPGAGYGELYEAMEFLAADSQRILMIWDGVDPTISSGLLKRNLWDNLLALGKMDSLFFVTSSRRKLQELIRDAESVTSEFWLLFDPVRLEPMREDDLLCFANVMENHTFQPGALKELLNWTGGIPPLIIWLLNRIIEVNPSGEITNGTVNSAAEETDDYRSGYLDTIWTDCPAPVNDLYRHLVQTKGEEMGKLPKVERATLMEIGLATHENGKLKAGCRLMERHIEGEGAEFGALARLFGEWDSYRENIRGILERRMGHIQRFDETLFHMVDRAIEDLPLHPDHCLTGLSHIEDRALDLIWAMETDTSRILPQKVITYWTQHPRDKNKFIRDMMDSDRWEVPSDRGPQIALLQLLTGSHQDFSQPMAKHVTKDTYVLLNAIHSFRNRSQHAAGQAIDLGVSVSAIMLCVELLACLQRELQVGTIAPPSTQP